MILIVCLLQVVKIAALGDIVFMLNGLGIEQELKTVKQQLSLLKSLGLIVLKPYRNYEFYLAASESNWISWSYDTPKTRICDDDRWTSQFIESYEYKQKEKFRALRSYLKSTGQIGD